MSVQETADRILESYRTQVVPQFFAVAPGTSAIYHYTNANSALLILSGNTLHASNVRFMNDESELAYAVDLLRNVVRDLCSSRSKSDEACLYLQQHVVPKLEERAVRQFVLSFSLEWDSLHLWNYYGRQDGYAIGFDLAQFVDSLLAKQLRLGHSGNYGYDAFSVYFGSVIYERPLQEEFLRRTLEIVAALCDLELGAGPPSLSNPASRQRIEATQYLDAGVYNMKFLPHSIEHEYRVVILPDSGFTDIQYKVRNGLMIPYVEIGGSALPTREMIIGPMVHDSMAELVPRPSSLEQPCSVFAACCVLSLS